MMRWKRAIMQLRARWSALGRTQRIAAAMLALALVSGAAWLAVGLQGGPDMAVAADGLSQSEMSLAMSILQSHSIDARIQRGQLMVPTGQLSSAEAVLSAEGLLAPQESKPFQELADKQSIWRTQEQADKQWQAAKMAVLGKAISRFTPVRSASVILEPGSPHGLGRQGQSPTACVNVTLKDGQKMTGRLVQAIADQVAGSTPGMTRQDVRIIDSSGQSFRASENGDDAFDRLQSAEDYFAAKLRSALPYAPGAAISVQLSGEGSALAFRSAAVSLPRSYVQSLARQPSANMDDDALSRAAAPQLAKIQQSLAAAVNVKDPAAIKLDWHYDQPAEDSHAQSAAMLWMMVGVVLLACAGGFYAWRRLLGSRRAGQSPIADSPRAAAGKVSLLETLGAQELIDFCRDEHPQTVAIVLSNLGSAKAAAVLASLESQRQIDVAKRLAGLDKLDHGVVQQVEQAIVDRLQRVSATPRRVGAAAVAEVLQQAGYTAARSVLQGLEDDPALAESIRRSMMSFEDLGELPPSTLRQAMDSIDPRDLAVALSAAPDGLRDKLMDSLPPAVRSGVSQCMEQIAPLRLSDVELAQQAIVDAVMRLQEGRYAPAVPSEVLA